MERPDPPHHATRGAASSRAPASPHADWHDDDPEVVRPYAMTRGRTRSDGGAVALELETLISTTPHGEASSATLDHEQRAIVRLCRAPTSVAEVAARVDVPLGVARVLLGDLAAAGLVGVHHPAARDDWAELELLERVLAGLRSI
jgi:Protein of unknown function (DUF742)